MPVKEHFELDFKALGGRVSRISTTCQGCITIDKSTHQWLPDTFAAVLEEQQSEEQQPEEQLEGNLADDVSDTIDLWRVDLSDTKHDSLCTILSEDEIQRAEKFIFDKDRNNLVRSRGVLRLILARCLSCQPGDIAFQYTEHGRPEIELPIPNAINFNLSHSGEMALIAVSRRRTVGIDLNYLGQTQDWQPIAGRSFSLAERTSLLRLPQATWEKMFYRIWSQKEAYTKALGAGYSYGFQNFTVVVDNNAATGLVADDKHPGAVDDWLITSIDAGENWIAALAFDGLSSFSSPPMIRQWQFCYNK